MSKLTRSTSRRRRTSSVRIGRRSRSRARTWRGRWCIIRISRIATWGTWTRQPSSICCTGYQRAFEWQRRAGAPSTTSRCPLLDACQALAKIFANFVPSRKYMKCGIILSTVFLSPASARTRRHDIVCFGWELWVHYSGSGKRWRSGKTSNKQIDILWPVFCKFSQLLKSGFV